jgi:VanZ family protein
MIERNERLLYWLPVFIWLELIFLLSSIPGGSLPRMPSDAWQFWAHRTAHIGEYSILGILLLRAYSYKKARVGVLTILFLSVFIFLSGAFDEWHQSFVPGRNCQLIDAIFDTICGTGGMFAYLMWLKRAKGRP